MAKEHSLPCYLLIAGSKEEMYLCLSPKALAQMEMQTALSRFWTWVINSISYDDDRYPKNAFL